MFIARAYLIASAAVCILITDAVAQQRREREFVQLGCYQIRGGSQQESGFIHVDMDNRRFSAIQLGASGSNVRVIEINVTYPTGASANIPIDELRINSGSKSAILDIPGNGRELREIQLVFRSNAVSQGQRTICAFGQVATGGQAATGSARNWVEIGCHTVDFRRSDIDIIRPAREIGAIERVRLNVRDNDVRVANFIVSYFGGSSEQLTVEPPTILRDRRSRSIPLKQGPQRIREITLNYQSISPGTDKAVVCVEGAVVAAAPQPDPPIDITNLPPPEQGWERFACQSVDTAGDAARINVGRDKGRYSAIQVQAFQNSVRIEKVDVTLTNVQLGRRHWENFRVLKDTTGNPLRFEDRPHRINTIDVTYRSFEGTGGRAVVCINGQKAESSSTIPNSPQPSANWTLIGCQPVQPTTESDIYQVGSDEGTYRAIRFHAQRNDVYLRAARIFYDRDEYQQLSIGNNGNNFIAQGTRTREYELEGRRTIRRIELTYRASRNDRREAVLCIEGMRRGRADGEGR